MKKPWPSDKVSLFGTLVLTPAILGTIVGFWLAMEGNFIAPIIIIAIVTLLLGIFTVISE